MSLFKRKKQKGSCKSALFAKFASSGYTNFWPQKTADVLNILKDEGLHKKGTVHTFISFKHKRVQDPPFVIGCWQAIEKREFQTFIRPLKCVRSIKPVRTVVLLSPQKQNKVKRNVTPSGQQLSTAKGEMITTSRCSPKTRCCPKTGQVFILISMKGLAVD